MLSQYTKTKGKLFSNWQTEIGQLEQAHLKNIQFTIINHISEDGTIRFFYISAWKWLKQISLK